MNLAEQAEGRHIGRTVVVVATTILAVCAVVILVLNYGPGLTYHGIKADIASPAGGAAVPYPVAVRGTLRAQGDGHQLWLWIKRTDERLIHPQDRECNANGRSWTCDEVFLGDRDADKNQAFEITLVDTDLPAIAVLQQHGQRDKAATAAYVGIEPPAGARVLDTVTVRRG